MPKYFLWCWLLAAGAWHTANAQPVVRLFSQPGFRGDYLEIAQEWSARDRQDPWNDGVASIGVPEGWEVWVYEDSYFRGRREVFRGSWDGRRERFWCGRISSIRVVRPDRPNRPYRPPVIENRVPVTVFQDVHFEGASMRIYGEWTAERGYDFWNDRISSVYVPEGYRVILYEHSYFRGRRLVLESHWSAPRGETWWNDRISSIRVERVWD